MKQNLLEKLATGQPGFGPNAFLSTSDDGVNWTEQTALVSLDGSMPYITRFLKFEGLEHF